MITEEEPVVAEVALVVEADEGEEDQKVVI